MSHKYLGPVLGANVNKSSFVVLLATDKHCCSIVQLASSLKHRAQIAIQLSIIELVGKLQTTTIMMLN